MLPTKQLRFIFSLLALFFFLPGITQHSSSLPHSTPEKEGISSSAIFDFVNAAEKSKTEFHSFILMRHGKVVAEGWWNPYANYLRHTMYSCSKSFTATAIGFAVQEKLLSLDDKVISFFPDDLPDTVSPYLAELSVRDVLIMSDGQDPDPSFAVAASDSNWMKGFLATPIRNEPGTKFLYNSLGTYMLSAIITKVTHQKVIDYLKPRLFQPLGISGVDWEEDTKGNNTGGWGLRLKTEDMAKFAQLFLQKGNFNGKQVLPASWVEEASTMKIMQDPGAPQSKKDSSDWLQGYCYQMWRCRHDSYRGDGAYGQFIIVMPKQDAVLAITAETADMQDEINLVWNYLYPAFREKALPENKKAQTELHNKLHSLSLPMPTKSVSADTFSKTFDLASNDAHIDKLALSANNNKLHAVFTENGTSYSIDFGNGKWQYATTYMPGPSLTGAAIENTAMIYPAKIAAAYSWTDTNTLKLVVRYIESPHTATYICHFDHNKVLVDVSRSLDFGKNGKQLEGTAE